MSSRPTFDAAYVEAEFEAVAAGIDESLPLYLIGGGAMSLRDLKASTKDVDVVVTSGDDHARLAIALESAGYETVTDLGETYRRLGATSCYENDDGCRFDVFDRKVANELRLTGAMRERSEPFSTQGALQVSLVAPEDLFLFKSVTGRTDDLGDMNVLVQSGLDFEIVEEEIRTQVELLGNPQFVTYVTESLAELDAEYGVSLPLRSDISDLVDRYFRALAVWDLLDEATPESVLQQRSDLAAGELDRALSDLAETGRVERRDGTVHPRGDQ